MPTECLLRLPAVQKRTGLARSTIYLKIRHGLFPQPISLGPRSVGWLDSEIDEWITDRVKQSRADTDVSMHRG